MFKARVTHFFFMNRSALLVSHGFLFPLLIFFWRVKTFYFQNRQFLIFFPLEIDTFLEFFFFCAVPSFTVFFYIKKKSNLFVIGLLSTIFHFTKFLVPLAKFELFHCRFLFSGLFLYIFFILAFISLFKILSTLDFYLCGLAFKCIVLIYVSFRNWLGNQKSVLIKEKFAKFSEIYIKLQEEKVCLNRDIFFKLYFLIFIVVHLLKN